jgi:GrpB-like predicted nucleotidyltransferase (UPF0157 family)
MTSPVNVDEPITVVSYNPAWAAHFAQEKGLFCQALSIKPARVQHIGSTSIAGMPAKPIVDIMLGLDSFPPPASLSDRLCFFGYEALGEAGVPGRHYFRKRLPVAFNVQAVLFRGLLWNDNLLLRDFLATHPAEARRYAAAKQRAVQGGHKRLLAYSDAKAPIITQLLAAARGSNEVA